MQWSRRDVLRSASLVPAVGLAGCGFLGGESQQTPAQNNDQGGAQNSQPETTAQPTTTQQTTETQTTETPKPVQNPQLATATGDVLSEIEWFGRSYFTAIVQFKGHVNRLYDTAEYLRRRPEISETELNRLESLADALVTFVKETLAPHFTETDDIVLRVNSRVSTVRRFAERGDLDRVDTELQSLKVYLDNIRRRESVNTRFSELPIHKPLLEYLTSSNYADGSPFTFVIAHPETDYVTTVRSRKRADSGMANLPPETDIERRNYLSDLQKIFGGVSVDDGRTGQAFVAAHPRNENPVRLLYLQRFDSPDSATRAEQTLVEGSVTDEGMTTLGSYEWRKVHYFQLLEVLDPNSGYVVFKQGDGMTFNADGDVIREDSGELGQPLEQYSRDLIGDIVYTYMTRAGPYLLTVGPSLTAYEERDSDAEAALKKTWVWSGPEK